jgi:hypothetical protein
MKKTKKPKNTEDKKPVAKPGDQFEYPASEDIYANAEELDDVDVDDLTKLKSPNEPEDEMNEKSFPEDVSGRDLDVPGSELDDKAEDDGEEDEENNSYSLGADKKKN